MLRHLKVLPLLVAMHIRSQMEYRGAFWLDRVAQIMSAISTASLEQSAGVAQIGEAVTQMDQATQQNAALVEQASAAAESLEQQSQVLVTAVGVFS